MAYFARVIDDVVQQVLVLRGVELQDANGVEQETIGQAFLAGLFPDTAPTDWVQTSSRATMRGKYAGVGDLWDGTNFGTPNSPQSTPREADQ